MSSSLFRRVTRYPVAASLDPRENRLTEVTAAVLSEVDGLAHAFAAYLLDGGGDDVERRGLGTDEAARRERLRDLVRHIAVARVEVNTQVPTKQGRFVDLEVLVRPAVGSAESGLLAWVEVKHGADLHGDQLDAYVGDIQARPVVGRVARVVILLVPLGFDPGTGSVPREVVLADWRGAARVVANAAANAHDPVARWLLSEYVGYLEEEGLSDPNALTAASALTLMEFDGALAAAVGICEHADELLEASWGPRGYFQKTRTSPPVPAFGLGYSVNREAHRPGGKPDPYWRGAWFEWGLWETASMQGLEGARGSWAFSAGATLISKDNPTKVDGNEAWFAGRLADDFYYFWAGGYWRLHRLRYPDELLSETTLEAQGRALGRWIVSAFAALADNPPPT